MSKPSINLLLLIILGLIIILLCLTILRKASSETDESMAMKADTIMVEIPKEDVSILCTVKDGKVQECKVVRFKCLNKCIDKCEVKPEPTPSPIPTGIPTPQQ